VHPTVIAKGYQMAAEKSQHLLQELCKPVVVGDANTLLKIAMTAMTGKNVEIARTKLAEISANAILKVAENSKGKVTVDADNIKIEKKEGGGIDDSELIEGIVLDKEKVHANMPTSVENAKIALLDCPIEIKETETEAKIQITDPKQLQGFLQQEHDMLKNMVDIVAKSGANVIFCQKGIDDLAQHYLAKKGIYAARRVKQSDMEALAKATGAKIIANLDDLSSAELGSAGRVEERKLHKEAMTFVEHCKNPKAVTILLRGGTEHVVAEVERAVTDAVGDLAAALTIGKCVAGGGAVEIELAKQLRQYAETLSGREQLAVQAFSESLEIIPRTLAENAGLDPIDTLTELKAKHDKGEIYSGLDVFTGKPTDMMEKGVIEPLKIKTQAIKSASEVAMMLLRIDDVIAASKLSKGNMPPGMPGGMGEEY
jgi:thermosome